MVLNLLAALAINYVVQNTLLAGASFTVKLLCGFAISWVCLMLGRLEDKTKPK